MLNRIKTNERLVKEVTSPGEWCKNVVEVVEFHKILQVIPAYHLPNRGGCIAQSLAVLGHDTVVNANAVREDVAIAYDIEHTAWRIFVDDGYAELIDVEERFELAAVRPAAGYLVRVVALAGKCRQSKADF